MSNLEVQKTCLSIKKVFNFYSGSEYGVTDLYMDKEFENLRGGLKESKESTEAQLNTTRTGEHVPEIERCIRIIK